MDLDFILLNCGISRVSTELIVKTKASWLTFSSSIVNWLTAGFRYITMVFLLAFILLKIYEKFTMY